MTLAEFIRANREEIDAAINSQLGRVPRSASCYHTGKRCPQDRTDHYHEPEPRNDDERADWIRNDEGLYTWAREEGVNL